MTERLVVRVALRDASEKAVGDDRDLLPKSARRRTRPGMIGGAVVVGLSIMVAVVLLDFSGDQSVQGGGAGSEARTNDGGLLDAGGDPPADMAVLTMETAAGSTLEHEGVSARAAVRPTPSEAGVVEETRSPIRPSVAVRKPVEKPKPEVSREKVVLDPPEPEVSRERVVPDPPETAAVRPTKPEVAAVVATVRSGQRLTADEPEPAVASAITDPRVLRAQLSAGVKAKEPTARLQPPIQVTGRGGRTIYYYSEVRDFGGQTLFHRWEREGKVMASVPFEIRGPRWRFYSRKTITPGMTGDWRVVLSDSSGKELASSAFPVR